MGSDGTLRLQASAGLNQVDADRQISERQKRRLKSTSSSWKAGMSFDSDARLRMVQSYLKLTGSIQMLIVPATDNDLDKKAFTWKLTKMDDNGFDFALKFKHPKFISSGGVDTLKIILFNADQYLKPLNKELGNLPNGYTITVKIPPQSDELLSI